jgi:hypothetical protein
MLAAIRLIASIRGTVGALGSRAIENGLLKAGEQTVKRITPEPSVAACISGAVGLP